MNSSQQFAAFLLAVFLSCMASLGVPPQDIKDGFYEVADDGKGQLITDISGNSRRVGPELSLTNRVVEIVSTSNWNDRFYLEPVLHFWRELSVQCIYIRALGLG